VFDEHVVFFKGILVEEKLDALTSGEFAPRMLRLRAARAASQTRLGATAVQFREDFFNGSLLTRLLLRGPAMNRVQETIRADETF
jgi:hypothetical protein